MKNWIKYLLLALVVATAITFVNLKIPTNREAETVNHGSYNETRVNFRGYPLGMCYGVYRANTHGIGITAETDTCNSLNILIDFFVWFFATALVILAFLKIKKMVRR